MPCVATDGGINGLRPWCDANPTCIGYAVEEDVQQVWFKAAAALDYHGMDPSFCPQGGLPPPAGTGNCPYGPHTGKGVTDAGGLYIKCQVSTAACQRSFLAGLVRLHGAVLQNKTQSGFQCTGKAGLYQCVPSGSAGGNGTAFPEKQLCLEQCKAPPPPPPGPPPPAPHYDKPYLRFAMVIPVPQMVDCTVTQGAVTHTWSGYGASHIRENPGWKSGESLDLLECRRLRGLLIVDHDVRGGVSDSDDCVGRQDAAHEDGDLDSGAAGDRPPA